MAFFGQMFGQNTGRDGVPADGIEDAALDLQQTDHRPLRMGMAVVAFLLTGLLLLTLTLDRMRVQDDAETSLRNVATAVREHLLHVFGETFALLIDLQPVAANLLVQPSGPTVAMGGADALASHLPEELLALVVSTADGRAHAWQGVLGPEGRETLEGYLAGGDQQPPQAISPMLYIPMGADEQATSGGVVFLTQPVFYHDGAGEQHQAGWITAVLRSGFLSRFFQSLELGVDGVVMLLQNNGQTILRVPWGGALIQDPQVLRQWQGWTSDRGARIFEVKDPRDGVDRLYSYIPMENFSAVLVVGRGRSEVFADWGFRALMLGLVATLTLGVVAVYARKLSAYLDALQASRLQFFHAEAHLKQAQTLAHLGSWRWDLSENHMWWSDEMYRLCGMARKGGRRLPSYDMFLALVHPADRAKVAIELGQALESGNSFELEHRLLLADGTVRFVRQEGQSVLDESGLVSRLECVLQDVTQAAELRARLGEMAKLSTLGEMATGMTHELSQPLNVIRMSAEAALYELDDQGGQEQAGGEPGNTRSGAQMRQFLGRITGQVERMGRILDHIRIFSRQDSGPVHVFDAMGVLAQVVEREQARFAEQGLSLRVEGMVSRPIPVLGHPSQFEQVLVNLLVNAREATASHRPSPYHAGAMIDGTAAGAVVILRVQNLGGELCLRVRDHGGGIPQGQIDRLFEPFFTTKATGSGPGLGLSVAYGIVSAMGGAITARNHSQGGAVFEIRLPINHRDLDMAAPADGAGQGSESLTTERAASTTNVAAGIGGGTPDGRTASGRTAGGGGAGCLLFLEDPPGALMALRMDLARRGFTTATAETLPDLSQAIERQSVDMVVASVAGDKPTVAPDLLQVIHKADPTMPVLGVAHDQLQASPGFDGIAGHPSVRLRESVSQSLPWVQVIGLGGEVRDLVPILHDVIANAARVRADLAQPVSLASPTGGA